MMQHPGPKMVILACLATLGGCESNSSIGMGTALGMLAAGSWPYEIAGHSSDFSEVYSGGGTSTGHASTGNFSIEPGRVSCTINGSGVPGNSNAWQNQVNCSDGRAATFVIRRSEAFSKYWRADGTFSNGVGFNWLESSAPGTLAADLARFRQTQMTARGSIPAAKPAERAVAAPQTSISARPLSIEYPRGPSQPDAVAVIIGNANYTAQGKDIPDVVPAHADAESFRRYAVQALGVREDSIIFLKDASQTDLISVFGSESNPKGQLFNWIKPGRSRVYVYYSGHGAPGGKGVGAALVPVNAQASLIDLHGYPLKTLYRNLKAMPAAGVTVVLEACFSGASEGGSVITAASPIHLAPAEIVVPSGLTIIAAGASDQIASWEKDRSISLFTKHYLTGMAGEADKRPYGNGDGRVSLVELDVYLREALTYAARRHYGRDQNAVIVDGSR